MWCAVVYLHVNIWNLNVFLLIYKTSCEDISFARIATCCTFKNMLMLILPASVYAFLNLAVIGIKKIDKTLTLLAVNLRNLGSFINMFDFFVCWIKHFQKLTVIYSSSIYHPTLICRPDPARVINMPPVIYVPRKLPGIIRCPVDANPPVTSVKWEKDGYPLRVEKVSLICLFCRDSRQNKS